MSTSTRSIREDVLRDPRYPVSRIADQLLPYLKVLVAQFHPDQIILFGSYAYGNPDRHSDVDLLVIAEHSTSSLKQRIAIQKAWCAMPRSEPLLPFELIAVTPAEHQQRIANAAGFYDSITEQGLALL